MMSFSTRYWSIGSWVEGLVHIPWKMPKLFCEWCFGHLTIWVTLHFGMDMFWICHPNRLLTNQTISKDHPCCFLYQPWGREVSDCKFMSLVWNWQCLKGSSLIIQLQGNCQKNSIGGYDFMISQLYTQNSRGNFRYVRTLWSNVCSLPRRHWKMKQKSKGQVMRFVWKKHGANQPLKCVNWTSPFAVSNFPVCPDFAPKTSWQMKS